MDSGMETSMSNWSCQHDLRPSFVQTGNNGEKYVFQLEETSILALKFEAINPFPATDYKFYLVSTNINPIAIIFYRSSLVSTATRF